MKKIISLILSGILMLTLCSCNVINVPEGKNASFFAYRDTAGTESNAVVITKFKSFSDLDNILKNYLTAENRLPILDLSDIFFRGILNTQKMRELRYMQTVAILSKYEKRVYAISLDGFTECGVTREEIEPFIAYVKRMTPRIRFFTGEEINADESYYSLFDGVILKGDKTPTNLPKGTELWVQGKSENVSELAKRADRENIKGIIVEGAETEMTKAVAQTVSERTNLDFAKINEPTFDYMGFFHSSGWYGPDNFEEIAALNMTNSVFMETSVNLDEKIQKALDNGFEYVLIYINYLVSRDENYEEQIENTLASYKQLFEKYRKHIIFYGEEPVILGIPKNNFVYLTRRLREEYPENIILTCMAYPTMQQRDIEYFRYCTDLAFDKYGETPPQEKENDIKDLMKTAAYGQRLWLVPWACSLHEGTEERLVKDINMCYSLIKEYDRIVGMLPFTYENAGEYGDWGTGLKTFFDENSPDYMPELKAAYEKIGKDLLSRR